MLNSQIRTAHFWWAVEYFQPVVEENGMGGLKGEYGWHGEQGPLHTATFCCDTLRPLLA